MTKLFTNDITIDQNDGLLDSFGRLRVSNPATLFADKGYINNELKWSVSTANGGTIDDTNNNINPEIRLVTTTTAGSSVVRQSRQRSTYQPSKSQLFFMSFRFEPKVNSRQRIGSFDSQNGVFLESNGTTINWVLRTGTSGSAVDETVPQANWSIDPMDGTGPSGITIDFTKAQLIFVDFEWLGVGVVRCGFVLDGVLYYTHIFTTLNELDVSYSTSATLPMRYEIVNTGTTTSPTSLHSMCQTIVSEGGIEAGFSNAAATEIPLTVSTTFVPVMSVRIKPTLFYSNIELFKSIIYTTSNTAIQAFVVYNGTLTGDDFTDYSIIGQIDTTATAITGGTRISTTFTSEKDSSAFDISINQLSLGFDVNGVPDTYTIMVRTLGGNADVYGSLSWVERY